VCRQLFEEHKPHNFSVMMRDRLRDRLLFLWDRRSLLRPTERDRAVIPLPWWLGFLHYVIRPLRLFREYRLRQMFHSD
jgi:hypothetical protein